MMVFTYDYYASACFSLLFASMIHVVFLMETTAKVRTFLEGKPGATDKEIAKAIFGASATQQKINLILRKMEKMGLITRVRNRPDDNLIGNYNMASPIQPTFVQSKKHEAESQGFQDSHLQEDAIKEFLKNWLQARNWNSVHVAWGKRQGIDIDAKSESSRWIIEVKGIGSSAPMRVNYFLGVLAETLQRMDDSHAKYSIALPDCKQFVALWGRLPKLAKERTKISALFVSENGQVREIL